MVLQFMLTHLGIRLNEVWVFQSIKETGTNINRSTSFIFIYLFFLKKKKRKEKKKGGNKKSCFSVKCFKITNVCTYMIFLFLFFSFEY